MRGADAIALLQVVLYPVHGRASGRGHRRASCRPPRLGQRRRATSSSPMLYRELHRLAQHHLARGGGAMTLSATTLLHEAYLDISRREHLAFPERNSFMAYASRAMRGLVIDYCRSKRAQKRGGDLTFLSLDDVARRPRTPARSSSWIWRCRNSKPGFPARAAGRPEVLLRLHFRRAGRHARRVGAHRAARLGKGAAHPAPRDQPARVSRRRSRAT